MNTKYDNDIFISYSRKDSEHVLSIVNKLQERGFIIWIDKDGIESGDDFKPEIVRAIKNSHVFLFFSSRSSNTSPWTVKEVNTAVHLKKPIIPVRLDSADYDDSILFDLGSIDFVDLSIDEKRETALNKLINTLLSKIPNVVVKQPNQKSNKIIPNRLHIIDQNGKYGFVNSMGEEVIPCKWQKADECFIDGVVRVQDDSGRWGFIDTLGNNVIDCKWSNTAKAFSEGLLCVKDNNNKWGFINNDGETVLPFVWDEANSFSSGLAMVKGKERRLLLKGAPLWGCIDKDGKVIIPYKWKDCGPYFHEGLLNVKNNYNKWGFIDINGKFHVQCQWDDADFFSEGYARVAHNNHGDKFCLPKWGFIDKYGKILIPTDYFMVYNFCNGITCAQKSSGKGWDVINDHGDILFHSNSLFSICFAEDLACVYYLQPGFQFKFKCSFINKKGKEVIPPLWSSAGHFSSGLAPVEDINNKWGYIDKNGKVAIPCQWEKAESFDGDFAWVKERSKWFLINRWDF